MPLGLGHALAVAPAPGIIGADDDVLERLLLDGRSRMGWNKARAFQGERENTL
jgi:hypothetical protein